MEAYFTDVLEWTGRGLLVGLVLGIVIKTRFKDGFLITLGAPVIPALLFSHPLLLGLSLSLSALLALIGKETSMKSALTGLIWGCVPGVGLLVAVLTLILRRNYKFESLAGSKYFNQ